jgi:hypothetical protein
MKRLLAVLATLAATTFVAGCSGLTTAAPTPAPTRAAASSRTAGAALTGALASCGLLPGSDGVTLGTKVDLTLVSEPHGQSTDVDAATARCTLTTLGMTAKVGSVFDTTLATGGYQTLQWGRWSASLHVTDTLHFEVDVFSTGR